MRRRGARGSRSEDGSDAVPIATFTGSLRNLDDAAGLGVTLSLLDNGEVTMTGDDVDLGTWPRTNVSIRTFDSTSFEFVAEGDLLLFTPDDPAAFRAGPLVVGLPPDTGRRRRRASKKRPARAKPEPIADRAPRKKERRDEKKQRAPEAPVVDQPSSGSSSKPTTAAGPVPDLVSVVPEPGPQEPSTAPAPDETADGGAVESERSDGEPDREVGDAESTAGATRAGVWIRALDTARRFDVFGLDRVPIDEGLRGREHEHTWDHRVATTDGLSSHVCTICGKIRFSRRPS